MLVDLYDPSINLSTTGCCLVSFCYGMLLTCYVLVMVVVLYQLLREEALIAFRVRSCVFILQC